LSFFQKSGDPAARFLVPTVHFPAFSTFPTSPHGANRARLSGPFLSCRFFPFIEGKPDVKNFLPVPCRASENRAQGCRPASLELHSFFLLGFRGIQKESRLEGHPRRQHPGVPMYHLRADRTTTRPKSAMDTPHDWFFELGLLFILPPSSFFFPMGTE